MLRELLPFVVPSLVALLVATLPGWLCLVGAGPRYRAVVLRQLGLVWLAGLALLGWLAASIVALSSGGPRPAFAGGAALPLLVVGGLALLMAVRRGPRLAAAALAADRRPAARSRPD